MNRLFLTLEDGAVFEGSSVNDICETAGLLSFHTGVVGYQEVITDPANLGKILLFTYPLIGNYGVNSEDAESASVKVNGILTKEYPGYYSNFRAEGSLADYVRGSSISFGTGFDTRAILLHLRKHGEMPAALSTSPLNKDEVSARAGAVDMRDYVPENRPIACAQARPKAKAAVIDLGASKSFYKYLADQGVDACCEIGMAEVVIVSDAPYHAVEQQSVIERVRTSISGKPTIGFGHGSAILARACGHEVARIPFGDHGVNVPVAYVGGGRNEITVQNHVYEAMPGGELEPIFTNIHDGHCEGFRSLAEPAAGVNFLPPVAWLDEMLKFVGVKQDA